jgi:uncharacterized protein YbjT (DUF2867 family)
MASPFDVVTGAFGFSGSYIARRLLASGHRVRTLTNHPRQPDPFGGTIEVAPLAFDSLDALARQLAGAATVFNTYWIRFPRGGATHDTAVANVTALIEAARRGGVARFVHVSITNANPDSPLSYFRGKGVLERRLADSGLSYAIIRPAVIYGPEDILLNNIAWTLRRFPMFAIPGDGSYRMQPIFVDDLAELAITMGAASANVAIDAIGPETFTFNEIVAMLKRSTGSRAIVVHLPPALAQALASIIGRVMGDVMLTRDEVRGLMGNLLATNSPPAAPTKLSEWVARNADQLGRRYASELGRRAPR